MSVYSSSSVPPILSLNPPSSAANETSQALTTINNSGEHERLVPFLHKLAEILEDPTCTPFIHWSSDGTSVLVSDPVECARIVLPKYFKHNTFASFVRQLNLYGFHKTLQDASWCEFKHELFQRNRPDLLKEIKRKVNNPVVAKAKSSDLMSTRSETEAILNQVVLLKQRQDSMEMTMRSMQRENEALWNEVLQSRQNQQRLNQKVSKVVGFLMNAFNTLKDGESSKKRRLTDDTRFPTRLQECNDDSPSPTLRTDGQQSVGLDATQPTLNENPGQWMHLLHQLEGNSTSDDSTVEGRASGPVTDSAQRLSTTSQSIRGGDGGGSTAGGGWRQSQQWSSFPPSNVPLGGGVDSGPLSASNSSFELSPSPFNQPPSQNQNGNEHLRSLMQDQQDCFARINGLENQLSSFYDA